MDMLGASNAKTTTTTTATKTQQNQERVNSTAIRSRRR